MNYIRVVLKRTSFIIPDASISSRGRLSPNSTWTSRFPDLLLGYELQKKKIISVEIVIFSYKCNMTNLMILKNCK